MITGRITAGLLVLVSTAVGAADVWVVKREYPGGTIADVVIEGVLKKGDHDAFLKTLKDLGRGTPVTVVLRSAGGDYEEAIKLGRTFRKAKLNANVPYWRIDGPACVESDGYPPPKDPKNCLCASACAFAFFGAPFRNGTVVGLHRPYFDQPAFAQLSPDEAAERYRALAKNAHAYLSEMGVGEDVTKRIMASASNGIDFLEPDYVQKYMWGWIPEIEEWLIAKCPGTRPRVRSRELAAAQAAGAITPAEEVEYEQINAADAKASACQSAASRELRISGFDALFGESRIHGRGGAHDTDK